MGQRFLLLMTAFLFDYAAAKVTDTLDNWAAMEHKISIVAYDPYGDWAAIRKTYSNNGDTVEVYHTESGKKVLTFTHKTHFLFPGKNRLLAQDNQHVEVYNLQNMKMQKYDHILQAEVPNEFNSGIYYLLSKNGDFQLHGRGRPEILLKGTHRYITTKGKKIWVWQLSEGKYKLTALEKGEKPIVHYSTPYEPTSWNNASAGQHLVITEKVSEIKRRIILFDPSQGTVTDPSISYSVGKEAVRISDMENGKSFLVEYIMQEDRKEKYVDIWYGNDRNLKEKKTGKITYRYAIWNSEANSMRQIQVPGKTTFGVTGSHRFLMVFDREELHNYTQWIPDINIHLYDVKTGSLHSLGISRPEVVTGNGDFIILKTKHNKWKVVELASMKEILLECDFLTKPTFSHDGRAIWFSGKEGIKKYILHSGKWEIYFNEDTADSEILNRTTETLVPGYQIFKSILAVPAVISKIRHDSDQTSSVIETDHEKNNILINRVPYEVNSFEKSKKAPKWIFVRENHTTPPAAVHLTLSGLTILTQKKAQKTLVIRQELIHFYNSDGVLLKGILHYPLKMETGKKYPMIVNLYQIQHPQSRRYLKREIPGTGFNIRALLERGYFVYMPDIIYNDRGTGLAALDAVHRSLDALKANTHINMQKVGLTGHSHGGYETNFIATHSDRFAAYISGAGNSDIVRSYFSYNYNFNSPFYFQFENGQYEMNLPFAGAKEKYIKNSPIYYVENVNAPMLLWAGKKDQNIAWDQVMQFYIGLKRNSKFVIALFYSDKGHDLGENSQESKDLLTKVIDWWDYWLKDRKDAEWIRKGD